MGEKKRIWRHRPKGNLQALRKEFMMAKRGRKKIINVFCKVCKRKLLDVKKNKYKCNSCNLWYFKNFHGKFLLVNA